jgi:hypothetical protein
MVKSLKPGFEIFFELYDPLNKNTYECFDCKCQIKIVPYETLNILSFASSSLDVLSSDNSADLVLSRFGGYNGSVIVSYKIVEVDGSSIDSAIDLELETGTIVMRAHETKVIQ